MKFLFPIEVIAFVLAAIFGLIWLAAPPDANWEPLVFLFGLTGVGCDLYRRKLKNGVSGRFESNAERIRHRERLRKKFEEEVYRCRRENLRKDVIVRHVDRVDNYPDVDDREVGISPWFRVGLLDTYERGIVLGLRFGGLVACEEGFRYSDWINGEEADIRACLMGDVPYDSIVEVNLDGDPYYNFPHIYCYFDFKGEPYERLWFAEEVEQPHGHPYYKFLGSYEEVTGNNLSDVMQFA